MATGRVKCPKCDRTFGMAAHLARHVSAGHGKKKVVKKKTAKGAGRKGARKVGKRGPGRPKGSGRKKGAAKRVGRPKGAVSRLGLKDMSLEQLSDVIQAARAEAHRRIADFQDAIA
jgi:uncharacterized C2H2 Zn-finger protein